MKKPILAVIVLLIALALIAGARYLVKNKTETPVAITPSSQPQIDSISPTVASVGSTLKISGSGFAFQRPAENAGMGAVYRIGAAVIFKTDQGQELAAFSIQRGQNLNDGEISFTIPAQVTYFANDSGSNVGLPIVPGTYLVSVWTAEGVSNALPLTME